MVCPGSLPPLAAQERAVAAIDQRVTVADECDCTVSQCGRLPRVCRHALLAIYGIGDFSIGRACQMPVNGLKHAAQSTSALRGQSGVGDQCAPPQTLQQS